MESLHNKYNKLFSDNKTEKIEKVIKPKKEIEIIVDDNHQLSEDAKFGHELSKDDRAWKRYFGVE